MNNLIEFEGDMIDVQELKEIIENRAKKRAEEECECYEEFDDTCAQQL